MRGTLERSKMLEIRLGRERMEGFAVAKETGDPAPDGPEPT
jgi:hypothetical protein